MKRWIGIWFFLLFTVEILAQEYNYIYQSLGYHEFGFPTLKINTLESLPQKINLIASDFISNRFGPYRSEIKFINAQILPLDSVYASDVNRLRDQNILASPLPYCDLIYSFVDSSLRIVQYRINIGIDQLGQVIYCNFPNVHSSHHLINPFAQVKKYADSLMVNMHPTVSMEGYSIDLSYNRQDDILVWNICYYDPGEKEMVLHRCLYLDAHSNRLIEEGGRVEISDSFTGNCCCDTGTKIIFTPVSH